MSVLGGLAATEVELSAYAAAEPGPERFAGAALTAERARVLETVYEGYLLHYREPRAFQGLDDDLRLLAGDAMYADGLSQLARSGDLDAVAELAGLISACARAHAEDRGEVVEELWRASAEALARP